MNFGEIKTFMGNKPQANPNEAVQQQLRETGLKQAVEGLRTQSDTTVGKLSSHSAVALRVFGNSLNQNVQLDGKTVNVPVPKEASKGLFDFEEIAKNVLKFVGGVISGAAKSGADEDTLISLFEQARSGVAKGIKMAEKDLAGFMNEDISKGISRSADMIEQGIQRLQDSLLKGSNEDQQAEGRDGSTSIYKSSESISASIQQSRSLSIRTADGDEVTIRFEDVQQFELNRQRLVEQQAPNFGSATGGGIERNDVLPRDITDDVVSDNELQGESRGRAGVTGSPDVDINDSKANQSAQAQQAIFVDKSSVSFSVTGELDESELAAIGQLVSDVNSLATTFFDGDVETAFNQALELGFNEQELTGFALQLARQERVEVVKAYESVSHFNNDKQASDQAQRPIEKVSDYLQKMLDVFEQSKQTLADGEQYEKLVNGMVNHIDNLGIDDLISAINDFHSFNNRLLSNLPKQAEPALGESS
ncbi:DUF5610 domain-containing protein [Aliiglaciecola sp. LCG003]|uniref:DUF5610 domain-containing protein n=1 Tax=Aliiglaciecola sp. LCG003 TaxID=3053655 RepID=UPI00257366DC|nr:DUF5610 domain-containing protein [Aliiglaciecola sp. LCG003]WJG11245.1 DUF5610 domain-containing protein [Aliiglaciecola sp. LCG003]